MNSNRFHRAQPALYAGLALTVAAAAVPYLDRATTNLLAGHIRAGYPSYGPGAIDTAASTYLAYLTAVGVLGIAGWLLAIRAARSGSRWTAWYATAMFGVGTSVALFNLLVRDTSGDTGLPLLLGAVGLAPCIAGVFATVLLWRAAGGDRLSAHRV